MWSKEGGADRILHFGSKITKRMGFRISFKEGATHEVILFPSTIDSFVLEKPFYNNRQREYIYLNQFCIYQFHDTSSTSPMKRTADLNDNRQLRPDGSNLSAFLYFLREKHKTSYDLIRKTVQKIAPFFDDFQLAPQN